MMKFGEYPPFGEPTPSRVISLVGPDRLFFLNGRSEENRGLGIGAFAYYRRVVENQKDRIIERMAKAATKLGAAPDVLNDLSKARTERQFSDAVEAIKHGIPQALLINGHNPLTLLHRALSEGIHAQSDEECLESATAIRVLLVGLAERIETALKEEKELGAAVTRLLQKRPTQKPDNVGEPA